MLELALDAIRAGCPVVHEELVRCLAGTAVRLSVDGETFDVRVADGRARVGRARGPAAVTVDTSRTSVQAVLAGRQTLAAAVRAGDVRAIGRLRDLVSVLDALTAFVHGAVRCDEVARLYDEFQDERVA
jgi:hypothetical protein